MTNWVSKSDLLPIILLQRRDYTLSKIPDRVVVQANRAVDRVLIRLKVLPKPTKDKYGLLKEAGCCVALDFLSKYGELNQKSGEVKSTSFGHAKHEFHGLNPLFFFATGSSKPFEELLPQETLRMQFYKNIRAYKTIWFYQKTKQRYAKPSMVFDNTSRGARWNKKIEDYDTADSIFGDTLSEGWEYDYE